MLLFRTICCYLTTGLQANSFVPGVLKSGKSIQHDFLQCQAKVPRVNAFAMPLEIKNLSELLLT